jgi:Tol biopolymer transport system component
LRTGGGCRKASREVPVQRQRKHITWVIAGAVVALLIIAVADALRSEGDEAGPPPGLGSMAGETPTAAEPSPPQPNRASRPFLLDLRTGRETPLAKSLARGRSFAASPDARRLAYVARGDDGSPAVFIARRDGSDVRQVTHGRAGASWPAWSPDGRTIAYVRRGSHDRGTLFVLDLVTGERTRVVGGAFESGLQFTPDGSGLVYTGGSDTAPELRRAPVAGGKSALVVALDAGLTDSGNGALSPDGSLVTFLGGGSPTPEGHCGPCRLLANADGTERRVVRFCYSSNPAGTWSPDGTRIVCRGGIPERDVIVVDITTGKTSGVARGSGAIWVDDRTLLVEG